MSLIDRARETVARVGESFASGNTVSVVRAHSLVDPVAGGSVGALDCAAASSGAASITISPVTGGLAGSVPSGLVVTIAGDATAYTTTSEASASSNALAVGITPVLTTDAAANTAITLGDSVTHSYTASYIETRQRSVEGSLRKDLDAMFVGTSAPEVGDVLQGYSNFRIQSVKPIMAGGEAIGWRVRAGDGSPG